MSGLWAKLSSSPWLRNTLILAVLAGACGGSFWWGRKQGSEARALRGTLSDGTLVSDSDRREVAYLYSDIPVTRAELGEYLIARLGAERLEYLVNRKIVEMEAKKANVFVSDGEVDARFKRDLYSFNPPLTERDFVNTVLKRFQKNLYEWKEDVIRPKIMMEKIVERRIQITDADLKEGFDARYGPRVECRMIVLDRGDMTVVNKIYAEASKGRDAFLKKAAEQFIPNLAQSAGKVPPIHKHFGDMKLEDAAFALNEGEISKLIELKDGTMVMLLCEKRLPADVSVSMEKVRIRLAEEMKELRIAQRIPEEFAKMREQARPSLLLNAAGQQQGIALPGSGVPAMPVSRSSDTRPVDVPPPPTPGKAVPENLPPPPTPQTGTPQIPLPAPAAMPPLTKDNVPVVPKNITPKDNANVVPAPVRPAPPAPAATVAPAPVPPPTPVPAPPKK